MSDSVRLTKQNANAPQMQMQLPKDTPRPALNFGEATIGMQCAGHSTDNLAGLPAGHFFLETSAPADEVLTFGNAAGDALKGRLMLYHFAEGWFVGRILTRQLDATMFNHRRRDKEVTNFQIFYEADNELLCQALRAATYAVDATSTVDSWSLVAAPEAVPAINFLALENTEPDAATTEPLQLEDNA